MLEVRVIRACAGHFRYRVPRASRGRQEPPQAVEFLPWDALGPPVCGVPGGQALRYGTRAPAHSDALNPPWCHNQLRSVSWRATGHRGNRDGGRARDRPRCRACALIGPRPGGPPCASGCACAAIRAGRARGCSRGTPQKHNI